MHQRPVQACTPWMWNSRSRDGCWLNHALLSDESRRAKEGMAMP